mmetsp:Transcript_38197/g.76419  ORF Transcript_38197/g.76419 Transcript_38197/m.76419 type:complete len:264 (-) Transcript_38197:162-953(-)
MPWYSSVPNHLLLSPPPPLPYFVSRSQRRFSSSAISCLYVKVPSSSVRSSSRSFRSSILSSTGLAASVGFGRASMAEMRESILSILGAIPRVPRAPVKWNPATLPAKFKPPVVGGRLSSSTTRFSSSSIFCSTVLWPSSLKSLRFSLFSLRFMSLTFSFALGSRASRRLSMFPTRSWLFGEPTTVPMNPESPTVPLTGVPGAMYLSEMTRTVTHPCWGEMVVSAVIAPVQASSPLFPAFIFPFTISPTLVVASCWIGTSMCNI